jgi:hypothetical protein
VDEVLIDRGQFRREDFVQHVQDLGIAAHGDSFVASSTLAARQRRAKLIRWPWAINQNAQRARSYDDELLRS